MAERPSGIVTFLFTDIEGSTRLWEQFPEEMRLALARHDELMRQAIASNNGVVFKTIGDAFCAAFHRAPDALLAAVDAQRALVEEQWGHVGQIKVRMALHSGAAEHRDNDYFGPTLNRVARLLATGHGGQILVSTATRQLLHTSLPPDANLRDLGKHRLKDLARPEQVYQCVASGMPVEVKKLKSQPSPYTGIAVAPVASMVGIGAFRYATRSADETLTDALSPAGLLDGLKGLVIELSTNNEWLLLSIGLFCLAVAVGVGLSRWRQARSQLRLSARQPGPLARRVVNQRTVALFGTAAVLVLSAWGYQQYLWRVKLPMPDGAVGIALTREASAATVQAGLADALFAQGQAQQVVVRELPVKFDARDTAKARDVGERIGAEAVIIYRVDEVAGKTTYVAYVVFTDPSIGLTVGNKPGTTTDTQATAPRSAPVELKPGVQVPVLRTDSLSELINAAAGIIAYDDDRMREAIEHLELAVPSLSDAPNTGIVQFYLGNAYSLDGQPERAVEALERAAAYYEMQRQGGLILGPQDQLILLQTYIQRGREATYRDDYETALAWYERGLGLRDDLLARKDGLERPSDVRATYARLYTLKADAHRFLGQAEDERFWRERAADETAALQAEADPTDPYPLVQQGTARFFYGDCVGAGAAFQQAIALDPSDHNAQTNAGIVLFQLGKPDQAIEQWRQLLTTEPDNITARVLITATMLLQGQGATYNDLSAFDQIVALYREILRQDPTNLQAHQSIARLASLRAEGMLTDTTALIRGDTLALEKSGVMWPAERDAYLDTLALRIDTLRIIAEELRPGNALDAAAVADAYATRANYLGLELISGELLIEQSPVPGATPVASSEMVLVAGEQLLADVAQIRQWTEPLLADPNTPRLARLQAWSALLEAMEWEWSWYFYTYLAVDDAKASTLLQEFQAVSADAVAVADLAPPDGPDEGMAMFAIYSKASLAVALSDPEDPLQTEYWSRAVQYSQDATAQWERGSAHADTFCAEERERVAGDEALTRGDAPAAQAHYEAALAANPNHVPAIVGLARARYEQGDTAGAIEHATAATLAEPDNPAGWTELGFLHFITGDAKAARADYERFLLATDGYGPQRRMASIREAIDRVRAAVEEDRAHSGNALVLIPAFSATLDSMAAAGAGTFQYPALYASLGSLALFAGEPTKAEPLLRRALELDPHQPVAWADLVLAAVAQGRDGQAEIAGAMAETADPVWLKTTDYQPQRLWQDMEQEAAAFATRFSEHEAVVELFRAAIDAERERQEQQQPGVTGTAYRGPAYGTELSWSAAWTVVASVTVTGFDVLQLTNGASNVWVETAHVLDTDPAACLERAIAVNRTDPTYAEFTAAARPDGAEARGADADQAYAAFTMTVDTQPMVLYVSCRVLEPGASVVTIYAEVPMQDHAAQRAEVEALLLNITTADGRPVPIKLPELGPTATT